MLMPTIDHYMTLAPYCVSPSDNLEYARTMLDRHSIRHLPVVDGNELVGVLFERDLVALENIPTARPKSIEVRYLMKPALSVSSNMPLDEAVNLMIEHELDCIVVRGEPGIVGIFTVVDALEAVAGLARISREPIAKQIGTPATLHT